MNGLVRDLSESARQKTKHCECLSLSIYCMSVTQSVGLLLKLLSVQSFL